MTLDSHPTDAKVLAMAMCECGDLSSGHVGGRGKCQRPGCGCPSWRRAASANGIVLGPGSPLRADPPAQSARNRRSVGVETEHEIQVAFFANVNDPSEQLRRPALAFVFAVPNGGQRALRTSSRLKAEGVRRGVPDVWCPVPRGRYCGLVIEFKRPGAATTPEQADWLAALARIGWDAQLHTVATEAFGALCFYLDLPRTSP